MKGAAAALAAAANAGSVAGVRAALGKGRRRRVVRKGAKGKIAKVVKDVLSRQLETKYVAQDLIGGAAVTTGGATPGILQNMLPAITQGVGDYQRQGERIQPISASSRFVVHFNGSNNNFDDLTVHLLILTVKGCSTAAAVAGQVVANTLLRAGNGNNVDPNPGTYTQTQLMEHVNQYPVNPEQYTKHRWFKHRFAKGSYDINGAPGLNATSQIAINKPSVTFLYKWKPPVLKFDSAGALLPTNHYPVYVIWCTTNDGGVYSGNLSYGLRTEIYYKDA